MSQSGKFDLLVSHLATNIQREGFFIHYSNSTNAEQNIWILKDLQRYVIVKSLVDNKS
jgi:predicted TPR repeat methyltransferase